LIKRFDPCTAQFETLPCVGGLGDQPRQISDPQGLAISRAGDLYVVDSGNRRVQFFALKGFALRAIWGAFRVVNERRHVHQPRVPVFPPERWLPLTLGDYPPERGSPTTGHHRRQPRAGLRPRQRRSTPSTGAGAGNRVNGSSPEGTPRPADLSRPRPSGTALRPANEPVYVVVLDRDGSYLGAVEQPQNWKALRPVSIAIDANGNRTGDQFSAASPPITSERRPCA
jgi:hypothetical protein